MKPRYPRPQIGEQLFCCCTTNHAGSLVYGERYGVAACEPRKRLVRVKNSRGRLRNYPWYCFSRREPPRLQLIELDTGPGCWEVNFQLTTGQWRWMLLATPAVLAGLLETEPYFACRHLLIVKDLEPSAIITAVTYLLHHGELMASSLPFERGSPVDCSPIPGRLQYHLESPGLPEI